MAEPVKTTALPPTYDNPLMAHSNLILVAGLVTILTTLIVPLPTFLLDMLIACSISLAVAVMVITLSAKECARAVHISIVTAVYHAVPPVAQRRLNTFDSSPRRRR